MNAPRTINTDDVYRFVDGLMAECRKTGQSGLLEELDDALHLGSSGLEILGSVRKTLIPHRGTIAKLLGSIATDEADNVIAFVDKAYGR
jgi:hypothetical protein